MTKYEKALDVLVRSKEEVINELARTGESGGTGLAQRYAPILVQLQNAIDVVSVGVGEDKEAERKAFGERMKAAREAKKNSQ